MGVYNLSNPKDLEFENDFNALLNRLNEIYEI